MGGFIVFIFFYILIGLILFYGQDKWANENDPQYGELSMFEWLQYFVISVITWGPVLIQYWYLLFKNKK